MTPTGSATPTDVLTLDYTLNVGIGTITPQKKLHVMASAASGGAYLTDSNIAIESSSNNYLHFVAPTGATTEQGIVFGDDDNDVGSIRYDHNTGVIKYIAGTTEGFRSNGSGISFDGGSNYLTEYEVGTGTPVLTFSTPGDLSVTYATQSIRYTRIGNRVTCDVRVETSAFTHTTASGDLRITGLPFTVAAYTSGSMSFNGITKTNYTQYTPSPQLSTTYLAVSASGSGQSLANVQAADTPTGGTVILNMQINYTI